MINLAKGHYECITLSSEVGTVNNAPARAGKFSPFPSLCLRVRYKAV